MLGPLGRWAGAYGRTWREAGPAGRRFLVGTALYAIRLGAVGVALPLFARARGFDAGDVGLLVAATSAPLLVLGLPVMLLGGRGRSRQLLALGPVVSAAGLVLLVAAPEEALAPAAIGAFLAGAGGTTFWTLGDPILAAATQQGGRTHVFALKFFALIAATALGGGLGGWIPGLLGGSGLDRAAALGATLLLMAGIDLAQAGTFRSLPAQRPPSPARTLDPSRGGQTRRRTAWALLFALTVPEIGMAAGYGAIKPFLSLFLTEEQGLSTSTTGTALALANAAAGVSVLLLPTLIGWVGHVPTIAACRLLGVGVIALWFMGFAPTVVVVLVCLALALIDGTEATYVAEAMDHVPVASRTLFSGLYSLLWSVGSISASLGSGRLQEATGGFGAAFALGIAGYVGSALWIGAVFPRLPGPGPEDTEAPAAPAVGATEAVIAGDRL